MPTNWNTDRSCQLIIGLESESELLLKFKEKLVKKVPQTINVAVYTKLDIPHFSNISPVGLL